MARCSYCGLKNDPRTALGFASEWNLCHHASPLAAPNLAHQDAFCLSDQHKSCPVFLLAEKKPLPKNVVYSSRRTPLRENTVFLRMGLAFLFFASVLIGVVAIIIYSYPGNKVPKGPLAVNANFSTVVETSSLIATATTTPTLTPTVLKPVCTPPAGWTLYIVAPADTMERLHVFYGIDVAKLESANCLDHGYVLRAGDQIYIPPMETSTPVFQSPAPTRTASPTPTSSPRARIYYSFTPTPTDEERRPKPPTPVPPTPTPAPTNTPVVPTVPPVPPTPTSPPSPTSPPPTSPPPPTEQPTTPPAATP